MPTLLSRKVVTARKAHRCSTCAAEAIQPGQTYRREAYVWDGRAYTWVNCQPCAEISSAVFDWAYWPDEGIGTDTFDEWASEYAHDSKYGEAARAYLERRGLEIPEPF